RSLLGRLAELDGRLRDKRNACVVQQPPAPPPAAPPPTDVTERGGTIGAVNVILRWQSADDLDLHVRCPDGSEIYYNQRTNCGGTLDVDANVSSVIASPVENIFWPKDA